MTDVVVEVIRGGTVGVITENIMTTLVIGANPVEKRRLSGNE